MLEIGTVVDGKYKILNKIGQGGMSIVYLAMNEKANKQWAIKEVRKDGVKDFELVRQGLIVETDMLKRLSHPNLPSIIDVIEDEETLLIVMDYIEGNPLSKALNEYGAQPQELVVEWAKQLCDVLGYLHTRKPPIIYRDMKPSNIMLKPDGNITLIDFGTAREFKEKNLADTTCLGTVGYAAPEQFGGQGQTDARTDIYCLGATLYHLVTGCNPCEPPYEIRPIREINPTLSSGLEKIIHKCTQKNPEERYQSCAELMYCLEHYKEIDDTYRKKQVKKLTGFFVSIFFTLCFAATAIFAYMSAEKILSENYDVKLAKASDAKLKEEEVYDLLLDAIAIQPAEMKAYHMLLNRLSSEDGVLTIDDASLITQLKAGLDVENNKGYSKTVYPLEEMYAQNPRGYGQLCYEIGLAFWYEYEVVSDRYFTAMEWFREAVDQYPDAQIYVDMGECHLQIRKYAGQNRTERMYQEYERLWTILESLMEASKDLEDNDIKLLIWSEIVNITSEKVGYFIVNISKEEMISMLDDVTDKAEELKKATKLEAVKDVIHKIFQDIEVAKSRINLT